MKKVLITIILMLLCASGIAQRKKLESYEKSLKIKKDSLFLSSINEIIHSIIKKDSAVFNNYIDKQNGIFWFKNLDSNYKFIRKLSFEDSIIKDLPKIIKDKKILFSTDNKYDCNSKKWTLSGVIVDTINTHKPFSEIVKNNLAITIMENNSRRIIVSQKSDKAFVFYLGFYHQKWWITFFDIRKEYCRFD